MGYKIGWILMGTFVGKKNCNYIVLAHHLDECVNVIYNLIIIFLMLEPLAVQTEYKMR